MKRILTGAGKPAKGDMMMTKKPTSKLNRFLAFYILILILVGGLSLYFANAAAPQGATLSGEVVTTRANLTPGSETHPGGRIISLSMSLEQQIFSWKAYVGNVSGKYVLQNANNQSIYEWPLGTSITGEVYISRNSSVSFSLGTIVCANDTLMDTEQQLFGMSSSDIYSINNTFNSTNHTAFSTGDNNFATNSCPYTALWINDTQQTPYNNSIFQEVVLYNTVGLGLVYATIINNDQRGYDNATTSGTFDFQAIVPENSSDQTGTAYYFYLELGS